MKTANTTNMNIHDIPPDVFKLIITIVAESCRHVRKRAGLQRTLVQVDKFFCCNIINSPIVSLSDALELRDPLAANIAVRHLARSANPNEELLNTPQVVGAAIRMRSRKQKVPESEFDVYLNQLADVIKKELFFDVKYESGTPIHDIMMLRCWNDEWKQVAAIVLKRRTKPHLITRAIKMASQRGHVNCVKLLAELMPKEVSCNPDTARSHLRRARCYAYLANRPGLYSLHKDQLYLYFYATFDYTNTAHAMLGHMTELEYMDDVPSHEMKFVKYNFDKVPPYRINDVPELLEDVFLYNAERSDYFQPSRDAVKRIFCYMEDVVTINSKLEYESFVKNLLKLL